MSGLTLYLKDLLDKLVVIDSMPEESLKITEFIRKNKKMAPFISLVKFADLLELEPEKIDLYFQTVGFSDYEEFHRAIKDIVGSNLSNTDRFKIALSLNPENSIVSNIINTELKNLNYLLSSFDNEKFLEFVDEINKASDLIIVGTRASSSIAMYAEFIFTRIGKNPHIITSGATRALDFLVNMDRNALVFAVSFPRYPKETINILSFLKKNNFKIISLTDSELSPIAHLSDLTFTIKRDGFSFLEFYAAPMCVINAIVMYISHLNKEEALQFFKKHELQAEELGYYF